MGSASAEPMIPDNDDAVLEHLPGAGDRAARTARGLRSLLAKAPGQIDLALRVAHDEIALGRAEGDPRYYGRAEAALQPWIHLSDPPPQVLLLRATLLQNRHDFDGALADLDRLIADDPRNAQALLVRATVRQVRGEYVQAAADCRTLDHLAQAEVVSICLAAIDGLTGAGDRALAALQDATLSLRQDSEPDLVLWGLTIAGEIAARLDRPEASEGAFRDALALHRRDVYLLGAYADFLLDRNRPQEVVALLKDETRVDPLLLRLAMAEQRLGLPEATTHIADLAQRFDTARRRGDTIHQREEARFQLTLVQDAQAALALAQANWRVQREPADALVLLQAADAARRPAAAEPVLEWYGTNHIEDARIAALVGRLFPQRS
jgi:tetratricopeptide (TPR) repeat protein